VERGEHDVDSGETNGVDSEEPISNSDQHTTDSQDTTSNGEGDIPDDEKNVVEPGNIDEWDWDDLA